MYYSSFRPEKPSKKWIISREQECAKSDIKPINKDFLDDLPSYIREVMWHVEEAWKSKDWFEEAWAKYRDHVLSSIQSGEMPKGPGFIFNNYIDDQIKEDFLNQEESQVFHSDLPIDELAHFDETKHPRDKDGKFIRTGASAKDTSTEGTSDKILKGVKEVTEAGGKIPVGKGKTIKGKYPELSDAELQKRVNRLNLEQRYSDLSGDTKYVKSGGEKAREILQTIGALTAIALTIKNIIK